MKTGKKNMGWFVAFSGIGINLALGILYTWSIFKSEITRSIESGEVGGFNWNMASINDPYAVTCIVFAFAMILAGKVQDRFGPRLTAMIGGVLVSAGFILISQFNSYYVWIVGFGVLVGTGIGFGYSAATPPALKWFPPEKTGLIAGLVVSGFGLASVYIAPLATYLIKIWGLQQSMLFFGVAFTIVVCGLSLLLKNPPEGYVPVSAAKSGSSEKNVNMDFIKTMDMKPSEILRKYEFYLLWITYAFASGVGLMVIGSVAGMAKRSLGTYAFLAVAILAIGNAGGRIIAGILSDKIGRTNTIIIMLGFQATLMFTAIPVLNAGSPSAVLLVLLTTFIGFNYGTNLSLFPSITKDLWGLKNFGGNYGILFTAWGVGGFVMARISQMIKADSGSFTNSFLIAGGVLILGMAHVLLLKAHLKGIQESEKEAVRLSNLAN